MYKAKRKDDGEWIKGYYAQLGIGKNTKHYIIQNMAVAKLFEEEEDNMYFNDIEIDVNTLCQYTGMKDMNDNKIFEHDIVKYMDNITKKWCFDKIVWNKTHASFLKLHKSKNGLQYLHIDESEVSKYEVIGNVFDNPELLGEN